MSEYFCKYILPTKNGNPLPEDTIEEFLAKNGVDPNFCSFDFYDLNWCKTNLPDVNYEHYEANLKQSKINFFNTADELGYEFDAHTFSNYCLLNQNNKIIEYCFHIKFDLELTEEKENLLKQAWMATIYTSDPRFLNAADNPDHDTDCIGDFVKLTTGVPEQYVKINDIII